MKDFHLNWIHCILSANWGTIADFLNIVAVIFLAIKVYSADQKRHNESQGLERGLNKPILIFKIVQRIIDEKPKDFYKIVNLGKGSALNIIVAYKDNFNNMIDKEWKDMVNCYSLGELEETILCWKLGGHRWIAMYEDIFGDKYYTICQDDTLIIIDPKKDGDKLEMAECIEFEKTAKQNISNTEIIKRLWRVQKENDNCKKITTIDYIKKRND